MGLLRKILRTQPTPTADGAFSPSALAIKLGTSSTTDYDGGAYPSRYTGSKNRVLDLHRATQYDDGQWQEILDGEPPC